MNMIIIFDTLLSRIDHFLQKYIHVSIKLSYKIPNNKSCGIAIIMYLATNVIYTYARTY